jgi:phytol kinase
MNNGGSRESSNTKVSSTDKTKLLLPITAVVSISLVTLAAFTQHLPGPPIDATAPPPFLSTLPFGVIFSGACEPYSTSLILRDLGSTIFSIVAAAGFVKSITYPVKLGKLDPRDARKLIHTLSAPLFILVWPLFSNAYGARVFATIVPMLNAIRLFVAGTGTGTEDGISSANENTEQAGIVSEKTGSEIELANAISRSGDAKEALQGPFVYVIVLLFSTFVFWVDNPIGVVSIATMAVGDGLADLIGRRFGSSNKWPFNKSKSIAGSSAFVLGSVLGSFGLLSWLINTGSMDPLPYDSFDLLGRLLMIAVVCAGVELTPVVDDNYSVPISAAVLSAFLLN